jgi:hypothetical protein
MSRRTAAGGAGRCCSSACYNGYSLYNDYMSSVTSVAVYRDDLEWLKRQQLRMSAQLGEQQPMAEVLRALIEAAKSTGGGA